MRIPRFADPRERGGVGSQEGKETVRLSSLLGTVALCASVSHGCNGQPPIACEALPQLVNTSQFYESFVADKLDSTGFVFSDPQHLLETCSSGTAHGLPYTTVDSFEVKSLKYINLYMGQREDEIVIALVCTANNLSLHGSFTLEQGRPVLQRVYEGAF